jgi:oligopeptide transport system permease protein
MPVKKYVLKRLGLSVVILLAILLILFLMLELMPGSPFNDEKLNDAQRAIIKAKYGLDQPVMIRFFTYVKNMVTGDFGVSYTISKNTPITQLLSTRLPVSLRIGGQAVLLGTLIGLILGIIAALKHNTIWDTLTTVISVLGVSLPSYVFALGLSYSLGYRLQWFPLLYEVDNALQSSVLPTISLSMFTVATVARFTRTEMLEVLGSDYMLLAQSKGISGFRLVFRHALRNALIPIITVLAPLVVGLMTGSLVVEKIFSIPGIGSLLVTAIQSNDYNVIVALAFIYSALYIFIMLVVDILYGVIDPRIRLAKEAKHA